MLFEDIMDHLNQAKIKEKNKNKNQKNDTVLLTAENIELYYSKKKSGQTAVDPIIEKHVPIVMMKFAGDKKSYAYGPFLLYTMLIENPRDILFIQLFVNSRGKQIESHIISELLFPFDNSAPVSRVSKVLVFIICVIFSSEI